MATAYKVLGQAYPTAATATTLYTVPSSTQTVVSTIQITNQGASTDKIRIAVRPAGASLSSQHYIAYDTSVISSGVFSLQLGITLATTDVLTVQSLQGNTSFSAFGSEIS